MSSGHHGRFCSVLFCFPTAFVRFVSQQERSLSLCVLTMSDYGSSLAHVSIKAFSYLYFPIYKMVLALPKSEVRNWRRKNITNVLYICYILLWQISLSAVISLNLPVLSFQILRKLISALMLLQQFSLTLFHLVWVCQHDGDFAKLCYPGDVPAVWGYGLPFRQV